MRKLFLSMAVLALLVTGATSAMAWSFSNGGTEFYGGAYDQIQAIWISDSDFASISFWYDGIGQNTEWVRYSSPTLLVATRPTAVVGGNNINMNIAGATGSVSYYWQQFNGDTNVSNWLCTNNSNGAWSATKLGNTAVRLANPAVPEPSSIMALVGGLGALLTIRRRKI